MGSTGNAAGSTARGPGDEGREPTRRERNAEGKADDLMTGIAIIVNKCVRIWGSNKQGVDGCLLTGGCWCMRGTWRVGDVESQNSKQTRCKGQFSPFYCGGRAGVYSARWNLRRPVAGGNEEGESASRDSEEDLRTDKSKVSADNGEVRRTSRRKRENRTHGAETTGMLIS